MEKWRTDNLPDLSSKNAIVTGANSGIGYWTAYWLAVKGARVVIASRNPEKADKAAKEMRAAVPGLELDQISLDLASLDFFPNSTLAFSTCPNSSIASARVKPSLSPDRDTS